MSQVEPLKEARLYPDVFEDTPLEASEQPNTMPQATVDALAIALSDLGNELRKAKGDKRHE